MEKYSYNKVSQDLIEKFKQIVPGKSLYWRRN